MSLKLVLRRTTDATRLGPITNRIIPTIEVSPLMNGIPAGSMDLACSVYQQQGG